MCGKVFNVHTLLQALYDDDEWQSFRRSGWLNVSGRVRYLLDKLAKKLDAADFLLFGSPQGEPSHEVMVGVLKAVAKGVVVLDCSASPKFASFSGFLVRDTSKRKDVPLFWSLIFNGEQKPGLEIVKVSRNICISWFLEEEALPPSELLLINPARWQAMSAWLDYWLPT